VGMDCYSKNGGYFRRTVWRWHPMAQMLTEKFPERTAGCTAWHTNDGDGLDAEQSLLLAEAIDAALLSGEVDQYVKERDARIAALPNETCRLCKGSGVRKDKIGREMGQTKRIIAEADHPRHGQVGWCNGCNGVGHIRPPETWYHFDADDLKEFSAFIRDGGGFEIR